MPTRLPLPGDCSTTARKWWFRCWHSCALTNVDLLPVVNEFRARHPHDRIIVGAIDLLTKEALRNTRICTEYEIELDYVPHLGPNKLQTERANQADEIEFTRFFAAALFPRKTLRGFLLRLLLTSFCSDFSISPLLPLDVGSPIFSGNDASEFMVGFLHP
jgi:hypothetical protein